MHTSTHPKAKVAYFAAQQAKCQVTGVTGAHCLITLKQSQSSPTPDSQLLLLFPTPHCPHHLPWGSSFIHASCLLFVTIVVGWTRQKSPSSWITHIIGLTHAPFLFLCHRSLCHHSHPFLIRSLTPPSSLASSRTSSCSPNGPPQLPLSLNRCLIVHITTTDLSCSQFPFFQQPQISRSGRVPRPRPRRPTLYLLTFASLVFILVACICNCHLHHAVFLRFHGAYFFFISSN